MVVAAAAAAADVTVARVVVVEARQQQHHRRRQKLREPLTGWLYLDLGVGDAGARKHIHIRPHLPRTRSREIIDIDGVIASMSAS